MKNVIVDEKKIDELLERGVETVYPSKADLKKKLLGGKRLRLYCGYDPSAPSLHIGNAISINKLSQFQDLGHEVIFLVGDFTGMIGDPTDKTAARKKLTREEVLQNSRNYKDQAAAFLRFTGENAAKIKYNSKWSDKLTFKDLIELSSHFTVQQMIVRDMFRERLKKEKPIYLHEFLYPLAQGYDSVAMDVDLEVGGNDQMFNMMCGRDLQREINNKEKFVMTLKLLADDTGKKMGKSEGNAVFLDTDANDMYGIIMSWPDGVIGAGFELCTKIPLNEVKKYNYQLNNQEVNPRDLKMKLAFEVVQIFHGREAARAAEDDFVKKFQKKDFQHLQDSAKTVEAQSDKNGILNIVDLLTVVGLASSKSEARRLIKQGGIKIDKEKIINLDYEIKKGKEIFVQRGKKIALKIRII